MAIAQIPGTDLTVIQRAQTYVQIKQNWDDAWVDVAYLQPLSASRVVAPSIPMATFQYSYGSIKREDESAFFQYDPLYITNKYVRIGVVNTYGEFIAWVGIIADDDFNMHGTITDPQGDQTITAYGLEHLLDRTAVEGAYTDSGYIDWCPPFNEMPEYGGALQGNRSTDTYDGTYVFSSDRGLWSNLDIIEYLLDRFSPLNIEVTGQTDILAQLYGVYHFDGLTLRQMLDKLIERRRGIGWTLNTNGEGTISIYVFSVFEEAISVGDLTISGNPVVTDIVLDDQIDVESNSIRIAQSTLYDRIIIQGERIKTCFTVSVADGNLEAGWTPELEEAYNLAAGTTADPEENDKLRASSRFDPVYQRFVIPEDWDWTVNLGEGTMQPLIPEEIGVTPWRMSRPLMRWVPIEKESDGTAIIEYEEPLVFVETDDGYHLVDKLPQVQKPGAHVRVLDNGMGVYLRSKSNHIFGQGSIILPEEDEEAIHGSSDTEAVYDYRTIVATVAVETDMRLKTIVEVGGETEATRTLVINVHDAEYWSVFPGTVTGVEDGELVRSEGYTVRDDSVKLQTIAALARAWYNTYRSAIQITYKQVGIFASLGSVITTVSSGTHTEPVHTVVTAINWDFLSGTSTLQTGYYELDIKAMLDIPGMSNFQSVGRAFNRMQKEQQELRRRINSIPTRLAMASGQESSEAGVPTVDFIIDRFDRGDQDGLGYFWDDPDNTWSIRGGQLYSSYGTSTNGHVYPTQRICRNIYREHFVNPSDSVSDGDLPEPVPIPANDFGITSGGEYLDRFNNVGTWKNNVTRSYTRTDYGEGTRCATDSAVNPVLYGSDLSSKDFHIRIKIDVDLADETVIYGGAMVLGRVQSDDLEKGISAYVGGRHYYAASGGVDTWSGYAYGPSGLYAEGYVDLDRVNELTDDWMAYHPDDSYWYRYAIYYNAMSARDNQLYTIHGGTYSYSFNHTAPSYTFPALNYVDAGVNGINHLVFSDHELEDVVGQSYVDNHELSSDYDEMYEQSNYTVDGRYGESRIGVLFYAFRQSSSSTYNIYKSNYEIETMPFKNKTNDFLFSFIGDTVTIKVNGVLVKTSSGVPYISKGRLGLNTLSNDLVAKSLGKPSQRITEFKAWADGIPEPPSTESGHGKYKDGAFVYTDAYHVTDPDTGVTTYNPTRFDES